MSPLASPPGPGGILRWIAVVAATVALLLHAAARPATGQESPTAAASVEAGVRQAGSRAPHEATSPRAGMVRIPAGAYTPQYATGEGAVSVEGFALDLVPVTVEAFLDFVERSPEWRRDRVARVFADTAYLGSWAGPLDPGLGDDALRRPVTEVSWFAARAYCAWRGARLPTTAEWEYAAAASETEADAFGDPAFDRWLLSLYGSRPGPDELPPVGRTFRNAYGVWDLHGLVWEWTADFNNQMLTGAGRDDRGLDRQLFCAAGSAGATDLKDYAAFLRYSFRSSLEGAYAGRLLGFRCAANPDTAAG